MKYLVLWLDRWSGDFCITEKSVHTVPDSQTADEVIEEYLNSLGEPEVDGNTYFYNSMTEAAKVLSQKEVTEEEFNVLNKYI